MKIKSGKIISFIMWFKNLKTFHYRIMMRYLRKRGWVVFYLEEQNRKCDGMCWLDLYNSQFNNEAQLAAGLMKQNKLVEIRQAVADYMSSEGCSCCEDTEAHKEHEKRLAKLLDVPMYEDESGYDFNKFISNAN